MEGQETQQDTNMPKRLIDATGKPFIQAEELTERIAAVIDGAAADHAIGFAAVFGALEQLKAQYVARVALKVSAQSPGDVLATHEAVGQLQAARAAQAAAELAAVNEAAAPAARGSIEKRLAAQKAPTKAPRPASEKAAPRKAAALRAVK
jgi:hypothetical protein